MSDALNGSVAPFCHSQDRPGSVAVPVFDQAAGFAHEDTDSQRQAVLGSRSAGTARHCCILGLSGGSREPSSRRPTCKTRFSRKGRAEQYPAGVEDVRHSSLSLSSEVRVRSEPGNPPDSAVGMLLTSSTWRTSATPERRYLPTAKAGGFSGVLR